MRWAEEFAAYNILEAVVRNDVVVRALELHRNGLLHQTTFFKFVTVHKGPAVAALLLGREVLRKIGKYLARLRARISWRHVAMEAAIKHRIVQKFIYSKR